MNDYTNVIGYLFCNWIASINADVIWYVLEEEIGGREIWFQVEFGYFLSRCKQYSFLREYLYENGSFDSTYYNKQRIFVDFLIRFYGEEFGSALIEIKTGDEQHLADMLDSMIADAKKLYAIYNSSPKFIVGFSSFKLRDYLVMLVQNNPKIPIEYVNEFYIYDIYVCIGQIKENTNIPLYFEEGDFLN